MKIKRIFSLIIYLLIFSISFSVHFENIDDFSANIMEETFINNEGKKKEYLLKISFPDKVYKEMTFPEINRGEKYLYIGNNKQIYYPILEEIIEEKIDEDENTLLKVLKDIKNDNQNIIKIEHNNELKKIIYDEGYSILFSNYVSIDENRFPTEIEIYENDFLITRLNFKDIKINQNYSLETMRINE